MLLASDSAEAESLARRAQLLRDAGLDAVCMSSSEAQQLEPSLRLPQDGAALLLLSDVQLVRSPQPAALPRAPVKR